MLEAAVFKVINTPPLPVVTLGSFPHYELLKSRTMSLRSLQVNTNKALHGTQTKSTQAP